MPSPTPIADQIRFGVFQLDLKTRELHKAGVKVKLQDQPFRVLAMLVEHAGEVVTREELQQKIWPTDVYVTFDQGLNNAIKKVRDALGDSADNPRFVETVARHGYRFIAPVSTLQGGPAEGTARLDQLTKRARTFCVNNRSDRRAVGKIRQLDIHLDSRKFLQHFERAQEILFHFRLRLLIGILHHGDSKL